MAPLRFLRPVVLTTALALATVALTPSAAVAGGSAAPAGGAAQQSAAAAAQPQVTAQLRLDCTHLSVSAHEYAVAHQYCPGTAGAGNRTTVVVWGNCGYSAVGISGVSHQIAALGWGFGSTMGTVVYHGLLVIFTDGYGPRTIPDNGPMFSSTYWAGALRYVKPGFVRVTLTGYVILWWGGRCFISGTSATDIIS